MKIIFTLIIIITTQIGFSQSIYFGGFWYGNKSVIEQHYDLRDKPTYVLNTEFIPLIRYSKPINSKRELSIFFQYSQYSNLYTFYSTNRNKHSMWKGGGRAQSKSHNFDIGLLKKIFLSSDKFALHLSTGVRSALVRRTWIDGDLWKEFLGTSQTYTNPGVYFLPFVGLGFDYKFSSRWHFILSFSYYQGLYGKMQETHFFYDFAGITHPEQITYTNGTAYQQEIGFQFDLGKKSKKKKHKRRRR